MPFFRSFQVNEPAIPVQNIVPAPQDSQTQTTEQIAEQTPTQPPTQSPAQTTTQTTTQSPTPSASRFPADLSTASFGGLRVSVGNITDNFPIENATVQISET